MENPWKKHDNIPLWETRMKTELSQVPSWFWKALLGAIVAAFLGIFLNTAMGLGAILHDIFCPTHGFLFS
ncbi:MAG: hypothetical protein DI607_06390 [Sphingomonas hengshuiensis]|nr:MAG: hypothetical protein DI607_06390 [Sphingomonas hengshuiensis]